MERNRLVILCPRKGALWPYFLQLHHELRRGPLWASAIVPFFLRVEMKGSEGFLFSCLFV